MGEDAAAFAEFVRTHAPSLYGTALVLTGNPDAAEELMQDTLARLYPKWDRVASAQSPLAYVRRAVINGFVSQRRRPASTELALWDLPEFASPTDIANDVSTRRTLVTLLSALPPRDRAALVMRYLYDLPDEEIAAALGCRVATVRSIVSRSIAAMHERYLRSAAMSARGVQGDQS